MSKEDIQHEEWLMDAILASWAYSTESDTWDNLPTLGQWLDSDK